MGLGEVDLELLIKIKYGIVIYETGEGTPRQRNSIRR